MAIARCIRHTRNLRRAVARLRRSDATSPFAPAKRRDGSTLQRAASRSALHCGAGRASRRRRGSIVRELLDRGADVNAADENGETFCRQPARVAGMKGSDSPAGPRPVSS